MDNDNLAPDSGVLVVFEGGEGAGKSTQIARLQQALMDAGHPVVVTREPGGSGIGVHLRRLILSPETGVLDPKTEALIFAADRAEHVAAVIRPALASGKVVLSDRYMDSSVAYQGAGRALSKDEVLGLSMWATGSLVPSLTVLLDVDPAVGLERVRRDEFGGLDRMESEAIEFMQAVRQGFLGLAAASPERYLVLDARQDIDALSSQIWARVHALLLGAAGSDAEMGCSIILS